MTRSAGRPKGAKGDADDELDILIQRRRDAQDENREVALAKSRRALREYKERAERREQWAEYHQAQAHRHLALARDHFAQKRSLVMEEVV